MAEVQTKSLKENAIDVIRAMLAVAIVVLAFWKLGVLKNQDLVGGGLFSLGFLVLAGTAGGRLAVLLGLPRLTGYLLAGLVVGPSGFQVLTESQVENLALINGLALALIALHAGCEFTNSMLKDNLKSLLWGTVTHTVVLGLGITALAFVSCRYFGFFEELDVRGLLAVSALFGVIAVSKSPAAVVAVLGETKSQGPLSNHAIGIVVLLDVIVLAIFAILLVIARGEIVGGESLGVDELHHLSVELISSISAGVTFGLIIVLYFRWIQREKLLFLLVAAFSITAFCRYFAYDTMLVFVVAGYIVTNLSKQGEPLIKTIELMSSIVMVVFFATAGASLHLTEIFKAWPLVFALFFGRVAFTWIAAQAGHALAKDEPVVKRYGFTPFISQAGLSIGLSIIVAERLPAVGASLAALTISVIAINEIVGPVLFKWGLQRAGELDKRSLRTSDQQSE